MVTTWMAETSDDFGNEHIVVHLDAGGPFELDELHESLAALARIYRRQHVSETAQRAPPAKLYVTRITSGSIDLEIVPLLALIGMPVAFMDAALIVREFTRWVGSHIRNAADASFTSGGLGKEDAKDLEKFVAPLTGRKGANLGITHARFCRKERDGNSEREIVAEYNFNESDINRAAVNLKKATESDGPENSTRTKTAREVLMAFQQADKSPGKERGRTGDRVIISDITDKPLPVYFPREATAIKRRILDQTENPFSKGYIVDAVVQYVGDDVPKMYSVIELHDIVDLDD